MMTSSTVLFCSAQLQRIFPFFGLLAYTPWLRKAYIIIDILLVSYSTFLEFYSATC